ncbi:ATP-dependent DNA helicase [Pistricoccus aurantiacus]|uniref:ATP-dependent DNA helicase n=1 Tax=Pistricoccus aurantiacus TaxID=1883414 RepID=A0A5B8SVP0_9GAMM|nr:ATP-dependent DNA helicase [Pistricoccus aurantiacus]QEA38963.1 ATP-dependent DNA helicase [Pistricoccus aurantiacus]
MNYRVAVRALCEFTARTGDLDHRFTPSPSAREGIAGHQLVAARRGESYESEISLSGDYQPDESVILTVGGRADGYDSAANRLEEIKTHRGDLARMSDNQRALHWAQVRVYGALLCRARELEGVTLALVYLDIASQRESVLTEWSTRVELEAFFEDQCERFLIWAAQEAVHRRARDAALEKLVFPYTTFRSGQRELAEAVYKAASTQRCLLMQAPTGIGKTLGTLFPQLAAMPRHNLDRLFYLTAKTTGRGLALNALEHLDAKPLRVLELVARDKACEHPDKACHGESCPLARGFYDRLPEARRQAVAQGGRLDQAALRHIALAHDICPYYLGQELARWCDVVVGDVNHYFDLNAMLFGLTLTQQWRVGVLVDEAHNLVERGRRMYSAELDQAAFKRLRRQAPEALGKTFRRIDRQWNALNKAEHPKGSTTYRELEAIPAKLLSALHKAIAEITEYLADEPAGLDSALSQTYFDLLHFCRVAELFDKQFLCDLSFRCGRRGGTISALALRNVVPATLLAPRFAVSHTSVLFSATLSPSRYYADLLGLPERTPWLEVEAPFVADQLEVRIAADVSTRFRHRQASLDPIGELMAQQFRAQPGNYLAFFSSFDYLEQVLERFHESHPSIPAWRQERRMSEPARQDFLARFEARGQGIGFAVLGGVFGEGIDLPGERLIGAFIATLGLPQINPVNEGFKQRLGAIFGDGYAYTYLYPGLQKVVQAAGRVIRTREDRGVVHLIDDRFNRPEVRELLPDWWQTSTVRSFPLLSLQ